MTRSGRSFEFLAVLLAAALFAIGFEWGAGSAEFDPTLRDEASLRVVTWNLGQELEIGASSLLADHEAHVLRRLQLLDADLVVLQELSDTDQVERLRSGLGEAWSSTVSRRSAGRLVVLLARDAQIEPVSRARLLRLRGRVALATIHFHRPGLQSISLAVAGVHAEAFSPEDRNEFLGRVRAELDDQFGDRPRILAGDFNIDLDPDARRDLFSDNAYLDVQTYNALLAPGSNRPALFDATANTGPTAEPDRRLDYILTEPERLDVLRSGPWRDQRAPGMDHDPLVADLALP